MLYGAAVPYARLLHEQLAQAGVTFNGPGVRPTAERPYPRAVLQLLALAEADVDRVDLFSLLTGARVLDPEGPVPAARWERLSRTAGVVSAEDWLPRLTTYAATQQSLIDAERKDESPRQGIVDRRTRDQQEALRLLAFVTALRADLSRGRSLTQWSDVSRWALELVETLLGTEERGAPEDQRAAAKARARWRAWPRSTLSPPRLTSSRSATSWSSSWRTTSHASGRSAPASTSVPSRVRSASRSTSSPWSVSPRG